MKGENMHNLKIDPEFQSLIPPLSEDEHSQLQQNIATEGCRDAIKIWRGIIVDGHNRYGICQKLGLPFGIQNMRFGSKDAAKEWIIDNQLGRRNLAAAALIDLALQKVELMKPGTFDKRKVVADLSGVSESTVYKYITIKKMSDAAVLKALRQGKAKIGTAYKNLEVITKTVTALCPGWKSKIDNSAATVVAMANNVRRIDKLYRFMASGFDAVGDMGVIARAHKRVVAQGRVVNCVGSKEFAHVKQ